jgi:hypothetical protein
VAIEFYKSNEASFLFVRSYQRVMCEYVGDGVRLNFSNVNGGSDHNRFISLRASEDALVFLNEGVLSGGPGDLVGLKIKPIPRFRTVVRRTGGMYYDLEKKTLPESLNSSHLRTLSRIWAHDIPSLTTVASHSNTDASLLLDLASTLPEPGHENRDWKALAVAIASNLNSPKEFLLEAFEKWTNAELSRAIASNPVVSEQLMTNYWERIRTGDVRMRIDATEDKDALPKLLAALSSDDSLQVCMNIARHAKTPEETLGALSSHANVNVRRALAQNPRISEEIQMSLLKDAEPYVVRDLILNETIEPQFRMIAIHTLSTNAESRLRANAARYATSDDDRFNYLLTDYAPDVRQALAANPRVPADILIQLLTDDFLPVRNNAMRTLKETSVRIPEDVTDSLRPESELRQSADIGSELIAAARTGDILFMQHIRGIPEYSERFNEMALPLLMAAIQGNQEASISYLAAEGLLDSRTVLISLRVKSITAETLDLVLGMGLVEPANSFTLYDGFMESGNTQFLHKLAQAGFDPRAVDKAGNTLLHMAVAKKDKAAADFFLAQGVETATENARAETAADVAAKSHAIALIRLLDTEGEYTHMVQEFEQEFPPRPQSRFLGAWAYEKEGFGSFSFLLHEDATGILVADYGTILIAWRESGEKLEIFPIDQKGPAREQSQVFVWVDAETLSARNMDGKQLKKMPSGAQQKAEGDGGRRSAP